MRFQLLLVGLATIVCFIVGGARWRDRIMSAATFNRQESNGRWVILTGDYNGLRAYSRDNGEETLPFSGVQVNNQAWDLSADLRRAAVIDNYSYSGNPGLKVYATRRSDPLAETAPGAGNTFYCPLFDHDGSLLFLDAKGTMGGIRRLDVPKTDGANPASRVTDIRTPSPVRYDDCFERSADGEWLAWYGSDAQIHVARKSGGGYLADHKAFPGPSDFAFSSDATMLAVKDFQGVSVIDVTSGTTRQIASGTWTSIVDFSPDGQWIAVMGGSGAFSNGRELTALRVRDGDAVGMSGPRSTYYYAQPGQTAARWVAKP